VRYLKLFGRKGMVALAALSGWLLAQGVVLAQALKDGSMGRPPASRAAGDDGSYVVPYVIVLVCVGLGVLFACRSSRRRDRARPEDYTALFQNEGSAEPEPE